MRYAWAPAVSTASTLSCLRIAGSRKDCMRCGTGWAMTATQGGTQRVPFGVGGDRGGHFAPEQPFALAHKVGHAEAPRAGQHPLAHLVLHRRNLVRGRLAILSSMAHLVASDTRVTDKRPYV